jgi:hypothetical protein
MAEQESRELRELAKALAGAREELGGIRRAVERLVVLAVIALVLAAIVSVILIGQASRATSIFG